jgi:membrane protein YdbS with pleckstrin-like domain
MDMETGLIHIYSDSFIRVARPSQWTNAPWILVVIAGFYVDFPYLALVAVAKFLDTYFWRYEFHERTLVERKGIFSVTRREIHYYRVKGIKVDEPLWMRFFGLANVTILSSDPYLPELVLYAVQNGVGIRNELRGRAHQLRKEEGVREVDVYDL